MIDFTSALYLGLHHPTRSLRSWEKLTMGRPASLAMPPMQMKIGKTLADLVGCERSILSSSTLHLFWDLFGMLPKGSAIYLDAGAYPTARWGVERAAGRKIPVQTVSHYNAITLRQTLENNSRKQLRPVVVADGFCPGCGKPAPIAAYLEIIQKWNGLLVLDDTQALGIFGYTPSVNMPQGAGGGGSLRLHNISSPNVLLISSLAKAFGAPIAALSGSKTMVQAFMNKSETLVHCSPPSVAAIHAAAHALIVNRKHGDALRQRLVRRISFARMNLIEAGFATQGECFPVQTLLPLSGIDTAVLYESLLKYGVRAVLHCARDGYGARISFLITARHRPRDIDYAVKVLRHVLDRQKNNSSAFG